MDDIKFRDAVLSDAAAICELSRTALGYECSEQSTEQTLEKLLQKPWHKMIIAEVNGKVAGYLHAEDYQTLYAPPMKNIMGIAVSAEFRRMSIGKRLLCAAEDWAMATGAAGIRLVSGMDRTGAHLFYERCGYYNRKSQKNFVKIF